LLEFSLPTVTYGIELLLSRSFQVEGDLMLMVIECSLSLLLNHGGGCDCLF